MVTFNGEIYNYAELREELRARGYAFRTQSDTEVLLHGYREWGDGLPGRLVGMFAFAIADRVRGELFLARDAFGEKPLFYRDEPGSVTFASELRPLTALPGWERRVDERALGQYLCLNYVPGEATLLAGVRRLPPATWRRYSARGVETARYWEPRPEPSAISPEAARDELARHLDCAVRRALVSDVPVGIFLSGGMDSSLVAESAARQGRLSRAYCLDFADEGFSEWPQAELVARRLGLPLTRVRMGSEVAADFFRIVEHADDPLADSSALAVWTISREAARGNKVVLGGDGGDELFGGYLTYQASLLHAVSVARLPRPVRKLLASAAPRFPMSEGKVSASYQAMRFLRAADRPTREAHFTWNGTWLPWEAAALLRGEEARAAARGRARGPGGAAPPAGAARPHRPPARRSSGLPAQRHPRQGRPHEHGPRARGARAVPPAGGGRVRAVAARPPALPTDREAQAAAPGAGTAVFGPAIADRTKQGFSIPIHTWLRGPLKDTADDLLAPESIRAIGALKADEVARVWAEHLSGRRSLGWEVWGLMVLSAWHRARVESRPEPVAGDRLVRREIPLVGSESLAEAGER